MAYAAYRFVPLTDPANPDAPFPGTDQQTRRLEAFCAAYGDPAVTPADVLGSAAPKLARARRLHPPAMPPTKPCSPAATCSSTSATSPTSSRSSRRGPRARGEPTGDARGRQVKRRHREGDGGDSGAGLAELMRGLADVE